MHQSIPASPSLPLPPPPRGYCGAFAHLFSPKGGAFANFALPGAGHWHPGDIPEILTRTQFPIRYNYTEDITEKKKQICSIICQGQGVLKACSRFYACISSFLIKPELHSKTREVSTWINVFGLVNRQISLDIIWRTSFPFPSQTRNWAREHRRCRSSVETHQAIRTTAQG